MKLFQKRAQAFEADRVITLKGNPGFALVATIVVMILLVLIALGLLSLSSVALRSSSKDALRRAAESNAKLSLYLALSELQKAAGPDQRVTASARILEDGDSAASSTSRPHLTGVWKGWRWDGQGAANYDSRKKDDFLTWLVSTKDPDAIQTPEFPLSAPSGETIKMIGEGSAPDSSDFVDAELVPIEGGAVDGNYAWVVLDQGQKALVTLPETEPESLGEELAELTSPPVPGFASVTAPDRDWDELTRMGDDRLKLISHGQISLSGVDQNSPTIHDLTAYSTGLPVNAAEGGLAHDLSLLFDRTTLPTEFQRRFLYSDDKRPFANPFVRFAGANVMPAPDSSWELLHSHARAWTKVRDIDGFPTIGTSVTERPAAGGNAARSIYHPHFHTQQFAPVIANAQFVFSLGFGASVEQAQGNQAPGQRDGEDWVVWLVTDPVITLWNPYDVSLSFPRARIDLYRVPLAFQVFRNGQSFGPPTLFANSYLPGDFGGRVKRYYRLNIEPALGEDGTAEESIIMKPGEHLVFTAHNHMPHYLQRYMLEGVDLRPGWNAPAGEASNPHVGGFSSLNMLVASNGTDSGTVNGVRTRKIPVKAGDAIEIEVTPANADVDKLSVTNNKEATISLNYYVENENTVSSQPPLVGAIELDYRDRQAELLPSFKRNDLPTLIVPSGMTSIQGDSSKSPPPPNCRSKQPFLITSLHLKTQKDSRVPARAWVHNSPTNLYASSGIDQNEADQYHQYEFSWEQMTDWTSSPTVEIDAQDRGFGASGRFAATGQESAPFAGVPLAPLTSMAQLRHAPVNSGGQLPLQTQVIGNSFAHPLLAANELVSEAASRTYLDHSFLANNALFDRYFFSSTSTQESSVFGRSRTVETVLEDFLSGDEPLPNPRVRPFVNSGSPVPEVSDLVDPDTGFKKIAAYLGIVGAFNINSTSVAAWQAVLSGLQPSDPWRIGTKTGEIARTGGDGTLVSRQVPPLDDQLDGVTDVLQNEELIWSGHRRLSDDDIGKLAEEIVKQVKARGPFQSLAEFVNRRAEDGKLGKSGALQTAIEESGINDIALDGSLPTGPDPTAAFTDASVGSSSDGAPTAINQADLLTSLAPVMMVRSDTFVIRGYGEASNSSGSARAWCEAVVQRIPAFVDPANSPDATIDELDEMNLKFGRRFNIISFRWLSAGEV